MVDEQKVTYAAMLVEHIMELRKLNAGYARAYPQTWDTEVEHFTSYTVNVSGYEGLDRDDFIARVKAKVAEKVRP